MMHCTLLQFIFKCYFAAECLFLVQENRLLGRLEWNEFWTEFVILTMAICVALQQSQDLQQHECPLANKLYSNLVISSDKICQCEWGECIKYLQCVVLGEVQDQVLKPSVCYTVQIVFSRDFHHIVSCRIHYTECTDGKILNIYSQVSGQTSLTWTCAHHPS